MCNHFRRDALDGAISGSHGGKYEDDRQPFGILRRVVWQNLTDVSKVHTASIIREIVLKHRSTSTRLQGAISQKDVMFISSISFFLETAILFVGIHSASVI
jgi:hypothetical protein